MRIVIEIDPAAVTPSGWGTESFRIRAAPRRNSFWRELTLIDAEGGKVVVLIERGTLRSLAQAALASTE